MYDGRSCISVCLVDKQLMLFNLWQLLKNQVFISNVCRYINLLYRNNFFIPLKGLLK